MSAPARSSRPLIASLGLIALVVLAYVLALRGNFLWDDDLHITANPTIVGPLGLREIWTTARANYFPLVLTNFWVQHALWGLNPFGYHVVTLACHALAAVLLWRVLLALRIPGAWLGAALWALHPVQTESVAWICELKNTQSAVFFLLSVLSFTRWLEGNSERTSGRPARQYAAALVCAVLALLSKPSTVMLPVALALCAWWRGARLDRRTVVALAPFFALSAVAAGWTIWEQKFHSGAAGSEWSQTFAERCVIAGRVVWFYLGKLAWPWPLTFIYPRWSIDATRLLSYLPVALVLVGLGGLWWAARRGAARGPFVAAAFFVALLFPVLGFFDVFFFRYSYVGDHFQYLASMGPLALLGAALATYVPRVIVPVSAAVLVVLTGLTAWQCRDYRDVETLWRATLARNPSATMAWVNLADTIAKQGRYDEALTCFHRALELKPGMADVHNDIGCTLVLANRAADAVPEFQRALQLAPKNPEAHNNLGNAWRMLGRSDNAIAEYRRALEQDPAYAEAHNNLGAELAERGAAPEAIPHFQAALRLKPQRPDAHNNLGNALRQLGRLDEAIAEHRAALALDGRFAEAHASLGYALFLKGNAADALPELRRAVELRPDFAVAHGYLARALAATGRSDDALAEFRRAVDLAPQSAEARNNLGTALAQRGDITAARHEFEAAVGAAPDFAPARLNLGMALVAAREWNAAAAQFERVVALTPNSVDGHMRLAVALVNAGRLSESVTHFETALRLAPNAAEIHANYAQVLRALGRSREALDHLEAASRLSRSR